MFCVQNSELRVDVLDPVADAARLGARYCWGGYIWQVHELVVGPLLRGPEWPHPAPSAFNGQGLPESFRHRSLDGAPFTWRGAHGVALGAGELSTDASGAVTLGTPCEWRVLAEESRLTFTTVHSAAGFRYELTRTVSLHGRELRSHTLLRNASDDARLVLEWFAHPFFPLVEGVVRAELPVGTSLAENAGFALAGRALTQQRAFLRQDDGHMERSLRLPAGQPLVATLAHPRIGDIRFATDFAPNACVIWGNDRTFSCEPYLTLDVAPAEAREWELVYRFGAR